MLRKTGHSIGKSGSVVIFTIFGLVFIFGLVAMVTDVGWMYFNKNRLDSAINASWKAGFQELSQCLCENNGSPLSDQQKTVIVNRVRDVFSRNGFTASEASSLVITFSNLATWTGHLEVRSTQQVRLFFANLLNVPSTQVSATRGNNVIGTGTVDDGGPHMSIVPIGIPHGEVRVGGIDHGKEKFLYQPFSQGQGFEVGKEYLLRLGNPSGSTGFSGVDFGLRWSSNHGSLDLDKKGGGAKEYRDLFTNGYKGKIDLWQRLNLKAGEMDGPVDQAREARLDIPDNGRVVVPIVDIPPESSGNQGQNKVYTVIYEFS